MSKKILVFFILITVIIFTGIRADASDYQNVDLGKFTAIERLTKQYILNVPVSENIAKLKVWFEKDFVCNVDQFIPAERMKIEAGDNSYQPGKNPIIISLEGNEKESNYLSLIIFFTVFPEDLPGIYQTRLVVQEVDEGGVLGERHIKNMQVEVAPWVRMELKSRPGPICRVHENKSLSSNYPGRIRIASNSVWHLLGRLMHGTNSDNKFRPIIKFLPAGNYQVVSEEGSSLTEKLQLLAAGGPTVYEDSYWIEMPYLILIKDFTKLKSGKINFPVGFEVRVVKEE